MKKMFIVAIGIIALTSVSLVNAQDTYKQVAGDKNIELQFAPLGGNPLGIAGIRYRSFGSETSAFRLTTFVGYASENKITQQKVSAVAGGDSILELKDTKSSIEIGLRPGIEKHMAGTDRLSPWMGAELDFGWKTNSDKVQTQSIDSIPKLITTTTKNKDGFIRIGVNALAGCDYYFAKKFYIGVELGVGLSYNMLSNITVDSDVEDFEAPDPEKQGSSMNFGPVVNTKLRIGYLFGKK